MEQHVCLIFENHRSVGSHSRFCDAVPMAYSASTSNRMNQDDENLHNWSSIFAPLTLHRRHLWMEFQQSDAGAGCLPFGFTAPP